MDGLCNFFRFVFLVRLYWSVFYLLKWLFQLQIQMEELVLNSNVHWDSISLYLPSETLFWTVWSLCLVNLHINSCLIKFFIVELYLHYRIEQFWWNSIENFNRNFGKFKKKYINSIIKREFFVWFIKKDFFLGFFECNFFYVIRVATCLTQTNGTLSAASKIH